jgi:hypothetical protein
MKFSVQPFFGNDYIRALYGLEQILIGVALGGLGKAPSRALAHAALRSMTCFRFLGPRIAGKFQFSGTSDSGRWTRNDHEAIEVHGAADWIHPAAG